MGEDNRRVGVGVGEALVIGVILTPLVVPRLVVWLVPPRWSRLANRAGAVLATLTAGVLTFTIYQVSRTAEPARWMLALLLASGLLLLGLLLAYKRVLGRWTMRRIEDRHLRRDGVSCPPLPREAPAALPFLAVGVGYLGVALALAVLRPPVVATTLVLLVLTLMWLLVGNYLHYVPNSSRRLKYQVVLVAASTWWLGQPFMAAMQTAFLGPPLQPSAGQLVMGPIVLLVLFVLAAPFAVPDSRPPGRLTRMLWRTEWFWLLVPCYFVAPALPLPPLALLQLLVRYAIGERLVRAPILYLRSFGYGAAPTAFARIVAPVARPRGVVVALAHQRQRPSDFFAVTDPTEIAARFVMVPDDEWQAWVETQMRTASVVVFDHSVDTESVRWERELAARLVPPERVIVLHHQDAPPRAEGTSNVLPYTASLLGAWRARWRFRRALRRSLRAWDLELAKCTPAPARRLPPGQLPGSPCAVCAHKLISIRVGVFCHVCGAAVHNSCLAAHVHGLSPAAVAGQATRI